MDSIISDITLYISKFATFPQQDEVISVDCSSSIVIISTSCGRCTYLNTKGKVDCEMCGNALRIFPSNEIVDLTVEEVMTTDDVSAAQTTFFGDDEGDFEETEVPKEGFEVIDEIPVLEVSGRRFGDTSKKGKNKFCGKVLSKSIARGG